MIDGFISRRLSSKLLLLTIGFVMLAELVIFVPSAALFRQDWFNERAQQAGLLAQALTGVPNYEASEVLRQQFMADTDVMLMAAKRGGMTELVLGNAGFRLYSHPSEIYFQTVKIHSGLQRIVR